MKNVTFALALAALAFSAKPMFADGIGTPVSGSLTLGTSTVNLFDAVPVALASNTSFSYQGGLNSVTALLTGDNITVAYATVSPFTVSFTDPDISGISNLTGVDFGSLDAFVIGDTLTIQGLGQVNAGLFTADITYTDPGSGPGSGGGSAVTPEPSSIALLGTGLMGVAGVMRRKFQMV